MCTIFFFEPCGKCVHHLAKVAQVSEFQVQNILLPHAWLSIFLPAHHCNYKYKRSSAQYPAFVYHRARGRSLYCKRLNSAAESHFRGMPSSYFTPGYSLHNFGTKNKVHPLQRCTHPWMTCSTHITPSLSTSFARILLRSPPDLGSVQGFCYIVRCTLPLGALFSAKTFLLISILNDFIHWWRPFGFIYYFFALSFVGQRKMIYYVQWQMLYSTCTLLTPYPPQTHVTGTFREARTLLQILAATPYICMLAIMCIVFTSPIEKNRLKLL